MSAVIQSKPPMDARVEAAISHWAPRFVANGVPLADFQEVTASVSRWEDWCDAWSARAAIHQELGNKAAAGGYNHSAAQHFTRAAVCYHFGKFLFVNDMAQMREAHRRAVECRNKALPYLDPPGERVAIDYEEKKLYGNLRKPKGVAKAPIVVMCMGLDSAKEEMDDYENRFLARGLAPLAVDGPGQGEAEYEIPICGDYERAASVVVDWIEKRSDVDAKRVAMWGVSLGGYYAPRAAAFEKRFRACIALSGPFEWAEIWDALPDLTRDTFRVRSHSATQAEARQKAAALTLREAAGRITCPLFIVAGRQDRLVPAAHAERLAKAVAGPVELLMVEDGGHNANNRPYRYRSRSADWLAAQFGLPRI